ncbi:thiol reductant ABC exporter subunit CydC [Cohaesibacter sp. CAU 1516]|nr:thiol reductant ABC exporter subunit CydC [Cohaesibacter sp. CAU 1516]
MMADIRLLLSLMRPWLGWILLGIFLSLVTLLANVTLMATSGWFIASMALAGLAGVSMNYFTPAAIIRAMAITRTVGRYAERLVTHEATLRLVAHLRRWFYDRLEPLAPAGLVASKSGDIFSRIGSDISVLENFYLRVLVPVSVALIALPLFLVFLSHYSGWLGFIAGLLYLLVGLVLPLFLHWAGKDAARAQIGEAADMRADLVEGQQALREMLVYGRADAYHTSILRQSQRIASHQRALANLQAVSQSSINFAANLALLVVLVTIIPHVQSGLLAGPILPMLCLFALASFEVIQPLPLAVQSLLESQTAAARIFGLVTVRRKRVSTSSGRPAASHQKPDYDHPALEFLKAGLTYPNREAPAFSGLSLTINKGERVALVGPSGSGKSSVIQALSGFWPLTEGMILVDGTPHDCLNEEALRAHFAVAPQKPHIFNASVRGNLLIANPKASEANLLSVLEQVQLRAFVENLPKGLDTALGEAGDSLSGGQVRRLAIARALLSPAPILLLDEPGEGLDAEMEQSILKTIIAQDARTLLLITHGQAGLELMDQIYRLPEKAG